MQNIFVLVVMLLTLNGCTTVPIVIDNGTRVQDTTESSKTALFSRLDTYFEASNDLDTSKILGMVYYKVFEVIPRDAMKKQLDSRLNNPMKPKVLASTYSKNVQIENYADGQYAKVLWSAKMEMLTNTIDPKKEEFMLSMLKTMMKGTEITLDKKQHKFLMETKNKGMFAIKENGRKWEFLDMKISKAYDILPEGVK